jgi:hypothetical protein
MHRLFLEWGRLLSQTKDLIKNWLGKQLIKLIRMMFISLKDYLLAQNHLQEMNQMEYFIYFGVGYHLGGC